MSTALLLNSSNLKVLIGDRKVSPHLLQRFVGDGIDPKLLLALGETEP